MVKTTATFKSLVTTPAIMFAAQPTLSAIKDLPDILQMFVYEFTMGTPDYRRHQFRYNYILSELIMRLKPKRDAESKVEELDALLSSYHIAGMVSAFTRINVNLDHLTHQVGAPRVVPAFFSQRSRVIFYVIWAIIDGPSITSVSHLDMHGWVLTTCDFFQHLREMNNVPRNTMIIHYAIQDFARDLNAEQEQ